MHACARKRIETHPQGLQSQSSESRNRGGKKADSLKKHSRRLLSLDFTGNFFLLYELVHLNEKKRKGRDLGIKVFQTLGKVLCLIFALTADIKAENR